MDEHFLSGKRIVVAGAGMAGLSFALAMDKHFRDGHPLLPPPKVVLYDRDTHDMSVGREGYSLSIVGDTADGGLHTLYQLGLLEETLRFALLGTKGTGSFKVWTREWQELISVKLRPFGNLPTSAIRIARKDLRGLLLDAVAKTETEMRWGMSCVDVKQVKDGQAEVTILDQQGNRSLKDICDLLVVADGASSKLRTQLQPKDVLNYAGAVQMAGSARFEDGIPPPVNLNWGGVLTGRGAFLFLSPVSKTEVVWALSIVEDRPRRTYDNTDQAQVHAMLAEVKELGKTINSPWPEILERTIPEKTVVLSARDKKPFYNHSFLDTWGPVVFIGDANHAVSPFGGNGANLALRDGWDLAERLCHDQGLVNAVENYDKASGPRAVATLKSSHQRIRMGHCTGIKYWSYYVLLSIGGVVLKIMGRS